MRHISFTFISK